MATRETAFKERPNVRDCLGFDDRWVRIIGVPIVSLVIPFIFNRDLLTDWKVYLSMVIFSSLYTATVWESNRLIFIFATRSYPDFSQWRRRLFMILAIAVPWTGLACKLIDWILWGLIPDLWVVRPHPSPVTAYAISYIMTFAIGALYESIRFFRLWEQAIKEKEQVRRAHVSSQLEGLRNQVNPHFLFNSLNTLIYLIPEDSDKAVRFVQQLSKVYRYVLESRDVNVIPLQEELTFLNAYIYLLRERFGDNLKIGFRALDQTGNLAILPLSLQMLLENAIKHNIISGEKPLSIELWREGESVVVRNNLQMKNQVMDSTGVGLDNICSRYSILTERSVEISDSDGYFTVKLPLIPLGKA